MKRKTPLPSLLSSSSSSLSSSLSTFSHFPSSRLVTFQHKIYFQPKSLYSFLKKKQEIMFFFSKTCSVFELLRSYLILAKVDTLRSSNFNVGVPVLLLRESLKKQTKHVVVLILVSSTLEPNCTNFILPQGQKGYMYGILGEF